jgi:hypothetical protein
VTRTTRTAAGILTTVTGLVLALPAVALAAPVAAKPAGGAAAGEVIGATAAAMLATAGLFALGYLHRTGRTSILRRAAERSAAIGGALPPWAALPVAMATVSLLIALFGMYWDISLHIDNGRDPGPLANPAHYFILVGLFGIFAAGFIALVLPEGRPSRAAVRISGDWYAPVGGVVFMACSSFALLGFPLDDMWHRMFGQDVTLWGPTHLMMFGGAGLSLLGHAALIVEGTTAEAGGRPMPRGLLGLIVRTRYVGVLGGLLVGLSTFQGEFDFGVPQFQLIFHPILIAVAAGVAIVAARVYGGRGSALGAVAYFLVIRGVVSLLVGPVAGETTPHFALYVAEAAVVELVALRVDPASGYRFGAICGALIGTVGLAAEWGWSHVWMPFPWPSSMLPEALVVTPLAGIAGGLAGAFVGMTLAVPRRPGRVAIPSLVPVTGALVVIAALVGIGLDTQQRSDVRAAVTLEQTRGGPKHEAALAVKLQPADAAKDAKWLNVTAWQGGGLIVDRLRKVGDGTYRTTRRIPLYGDWKTLIRLHDGRSIVSVPVYLPADPAIPAPGVAAPARFDRSFVPDVRILQRERKRDVSGALFPIGGGVVLAIALALLASLGWALLRLARSASEAEPPARPTPRRAQRPLQPVAPGGAR